MSDITEHKSESRLAEGLITDVCEKHNFDIFVVLNACMHIAAKILVSEFNTKEQLEKECAVLASALKSTCFSLHAKGEDE